MTVSTQHYTDAIKQQYCEFFGVDKFEWEYLPSLQYIPIQERTEILYSCFGLLQHTQTVKFYPILIRWEIDGRSFRVLLDPIIEEYNTGRDTRYREDAQAMKELILSKIKESYALL